MKQDFTQEEAERHDALYEEGWALIEGEILIEGSCPVGKPGWFARRKLHRAISCFEQALKINAAGWQAMWALGKIYQRLGEQEQALEWFGRAHALNQDQPDVAREAGLAALDLGKGKAAVRYCAEAIAANPDDAGLISNLALGHLICGDLSAAQRSAEEAVARAPGDKITKEVLSLIRQVANGRRPRPRTMREING